ncbi:MAG: pyridoxal phosphate-dependent decarboxylase family protein [Pseudomonadales bacterium]
MVLETQSLELLSDALATLEQSFDAMPAFETTVETNTDLAAMRKVLQEVAEKMQDNFPYPHPLYAGQMLKPPHPVARLAYMLSLWVNPNNHALDGGRASSALEKEAVANIARMFGWEEHLGHLTSGGTVANLEALWVAGRLHPDKIVVASKQAHYTHARISGVLGLGYEAIAVDSQARMDIAALESVLATGDVGTVVATMGTTGVGSVDPLMEILQLQQKYGFRVHVDAAYGGYFTLVDNLQSQTKDHFDSIGAVDSIVIDPHKHGLQPYGCGCILFKDTGVGSIYKHDSPYTYFSSEELHLGEISLECSRAGASAVALWATQRLLPMERGGKFSRDLANSRAAAIELYQRLSDDADFRTIFAPELDIVIWSSRAQKASLISKQSQQCFAAAAERGLHLALVTLPEELLKPHCPDVEFDDATVTCLRSCLMKAEHLQWLDEIWALLKESTVVTKDANAS